MKVLSELRKNHVKFCEKIQKYKGVSEKFLIVYERIAF